MRRRPRPNPSNKLRHRASNNRSLNPRRLRVRLPPDRQPHSRRGPAPTDHPGAGRPLGNLVAEVTLALVLAAIVVIIIDLDHPYQGLIVLSQDMITQLGQTMRP